MTSRDRLPGGLPALLSRHRPPRPPEGLEHRVLEAAGAALGRAAPPTLSDRIWMSRNWRLGWAAALLALVLGQALVPRLVTSGARRNLALEHVTAPPGAGDQVTMAQQAAGDMSLAPSAGVRLAAALPTGPLRLSSLNPPPPE